MSKVSILVVDVGERESASCAIVVGGGGGERFVKEKDKRGNRK